MRPVGIDTLVKDMQLHFSNTLPWLEKSFNRATMMSKVINDESVLFPACWVADAKDELDMIANDNWSAYSFFFATSAEQPLDEYYDYGTTTYTQDLSVYFWVNMEKVDPSKNV